jgi:hypothetical protein
MSTIDSSLSVRSGWFEKTNASQKVEIHDFAPNNDLKHIDQWSSEIGDTFEENAEDAFMKLSEFSDRWKSIGRHIGVLRLHKHFDLERDEIQVATMRSGRLVINVINTKDLPKDAVPIACRFVCGAWKPFHFFVGKDTGEEERHEIVVRAENWRKLERSGALTFLGNYFTERGAHDLFGLSLDYVEVLLRDEGQIVELTDEANRVQTFVRREWPTSGARWMVTHVFPKNPIQLNCTTVCQMNTYYYCEEDDSGERAQHLKSSSERHECVAHNYHRYGANESSE